MPDKPLDVTALGELLIDFTGNGISDQGNPLYEANPGGAPGNVLAMLGKLGRKTAFIGKTGDDGFGRQLKKALEESGIRADGLVFDKDVHTTLALVHTLEGGQRDFSFYRDPGADMNLKPEEVDEQLIRDAKIFHFGTLSLTDDPVRMATYKAMRTAEESGLIRSFDPNIRPPLWKSMDEAKTQTDWGFRHCDVLKIADNELVWFTGTDDYDEGIRYLRKRYPISLICLSMGDQGSVAYYRDLRVQAQAFIRPDTIETTGAGDTFCACVLDGVLRYGLDQLNEERLRKSCPFLDGKSWERASPPCF